MFTLDRCQAQWVGLSEIDASDWHFRFRNTIDVKDLVRSLKADGQRLPIILWQRNDGRKQMICGFRRYEAAKQLGWEKILACTVPESEVSAEEALKINFSENIARKSLKDTDFAFAAKRLNEQGKSNIEIAALLGKSEGMIRVYLQVGALPQETQEQIKQGKLSLSKALGGNVSHKAKERFAFNATKSGFQLLVKFSAKKDNYDDVLRFLRDKTVEIENMKTGQQAQT